MKRTAFYFRDWFPRIVGPFTRNEYFNSVHYGILWLGIIRYKKLADCDFERLKTSN